MDRPARRFGTRALRVAALLASLAALGWLVSSRLLRESPAPSATGSQTSAPAPTPAPTAPEVAVPGPSPDDAAGSQAPAELEAGALGDAWALVDLDAIREAMPDNLYWQMAAPTHDARILREREEERARWNEQYGKVLSGTASEDEIRAYYAHRYKLSTDYVQFVDYVLEHHQRDLPEQDVGLLMLARRLHLARLEEVPRKQEEAFARKRAQDAARDAWLAEQEAFEPPEADPPAPD